MCRCVLAIFALVLPSCAIETAAEAVAAEKLHRQALSKDPEYEPAYLALAKQYLGGHNTGNGLKIALAGLERIPNSHALLLLKEEIFRTNGDMVSAGSRLDQSSGAEGDLELLRQRAQLEDWYGSRSEDTYASLSELLLQKRATQDAAQACRRGVFVALRNEHYDSARRFAACLAGAGHKQGLDLTEPKKSKGEDNVELLGGANAFHFLIFGNDLGDPDRLMLDYSRFLERSAGSKVTAKANLAQVSETIHEYFRQLSALVPLGERRNDRVEIVLSLADKPAKQRTQRVLNVLGLKVSRRAGRVIIQSAANKADAKKQDTLAALAIDDQAIQDALSAGKPFHLNIPIGRIAVFPTEQLWRRGFYTGQQFRGGIVEAFLSDIRMPRLYVALNSMDRRAAEKLASTTALRRMAEVWGSQLENYSTAIALEGNRAQVPGGLQAASVWTSVVGVDPANGLEFIDALIMRDSGRLMAFFYALSQLDRSHQQFLTLSSQRTQRYYELFRELVDTQASNPTGPNGSFIDFLRDVPLNEDGSVDFPGGPEVWLVAKGTHNSAGSVAKLTKKLKRTTAPDNEDEILIRLAKTAYKAEGRSKSELANFVAVARLDAIRNEPLSPAAALLLAQNYSAFGALYPYFAALGDLDVTDYELLFRIGTRFESGDPALNNLRLGEFHSVIAMLCAARRNHVSERRIREIYRSTMQKYAAAADALSWTDASLSAVHAIANLRGKAERSSTDENLRLVLTGGDEPTPVNKSYAEVLLLQKAPSLEGLFKICEDLKSLPERPGLLDDIQTQLHRVPVLPIPKDWKLGGEPKKAIELYRTSEASETVAKLRAKILRRSSREIQRDRLRIEQLKDELTAQLEPWVELAMAAHIYALYLRPTDILCSEDQMLLRKHQFVTLLSGKPVPFMRSDLLISNSGEGTHFVGGFAEFSLTSGRARAAGNHLGGSAGEAFAGAVFGSVRGTNLSQLSGSSLQVFGATVRFAREWIVESAQSTVMLRALEEESLGLLSLARRASVLTGIEIRDWPAVWHSLSMSDLYFLGAALVHRDTDPNGDSSALEAMRKAACQPADLDALGPVAPDLSGSAEARLRRYPPYEDYERYSTPELLAERTAELKLYLAWIADGCNWPPSTLAKLAPAAADLVVAHTQTQDLWDWTSMLDAYRGLRPEDLQALVSKQ